MARDTIYDRDLDRVPANHQPLTPLLYLERAARVFPDQVAVIHGALRSANIGYWIDSAVAGRGITPTAVAMAVASPRSSAGTRRIIPVPRGPASGGRR